MARRLRKPMRKARCTSSHITQAMNPWSSNPPIFTTALYRDTVAMEPLSKYLNAGRPADDCLPSTSREICVATNLAPWIATGDTPGSLSRLIMSPITKISGWPGSEKSLFTWTRPARSTSAPVWSASILPSGLALTPADQILQAAAIRCVVPSASLTSTPAESTLVTMALSNTSTPSFSSRSCAALPSFSPNGGSRPGAASSRMMRACDGSIRR